MDIMEAKDLKQLEMEIQHIFDSGANEIRILNMVKIFIEQRYMLTCQHCEAKASLVICMCSEHEKAIYGD